MNFEREIDFVNTFVQPEKQERYIGFLRSLKNRRKFLDELYHFKDFAPTCMFDLSGKIDSCEGLLSDLRRRGAPDNCYVISAHPYLDGVTRPLKDAISEVFSLIDGTLIFCIPGQLAYYEGEAPKNRYILHRQNLNAKHRA